MSVKVPFVSVTANVYVPESPENWVAGFVIKSVARKSNCPPPEPPDILIGLAKGKEALLGVAVAVGESVSVPPTSRFRLRPVRSGSLYPAVAIVGRLSMNT